MSESAARRKVRDLLDRIDLDETTVWEDGFISDVEDRLLDASWEPTAEQLRKLEQIADERS